MNAKNNIRIIKKGKKHVAQIDFYWSKDRWSNIFPERETKALAMQDIKRFDRPLHKK